MEQVSLDDLDDRMGPATVKRPLSNALDTTALALNYYELDPGETFGLGYHRHPEQEEVFYVQSGTATFETEAGDVTVDAGEAVRFAPGEWQLGRNDGEERVVALAMGAPKDASQTEMVRHCEDCGERTTQRVALSDDRDALLTYCTACDARTGRFT